MLLLALFIGQACACEVELRKVLTKEFSPRVEDYHEMRGGLDYIGEFDLCKSGTDSIYAAVIWETDGVYTATFGTCLPAGCSENVAGKVLRDYADEANIKSTGILIEFIDFNQTSELDWSGKVFMVLFGVLIVLNMSPVLERNLKFNRFSNLYFDPKQYLKNLVYEIRTGDNLEVFDGIRSICSTLVIFYHNMILENFLPKQNRSHYNQTQSDLGNTLICSLSLSVDVFIILAGFLMSYQTVSQIQLKKQAFSWTSHLLRRYFRYMPAYLTLIALQRVLQKPFPNTENFLLPFIHSRRVVTPWWHGLLLIQNLFVSDDVMYLGWTWSVCTDFQLFVLCSIIVYFYCKNKSAGYFCALVLVVASVWYTWVLADFYKLSPDFVDLAFNRKVFNLVYSRPLHRCVEYVFGVVLGLVYLSSKKTNETDAYSVADTQGQSIENRCVLYIKQEKNSNFIGKTGVILILLCYFGPYFIKTNQNSLSQPSKSALFALYRLIFSIGFSFTLIPLLFNNWKTVAAFLSLKLFKIYSKISYSIYLLHYLVIFALRFSGQGYIEYSLLQSIQAYIQVLIVSISFSVFVYVLVECPAFKLEKTHFR